MKLRNPATLLVSSPCPSRVLRFTVVPRGCVCPLKHCHTAILVPAGLWDPAYDVAYQSKVQGKVRGVSSRQSPRCQVWNNALIAPELWGTTSLRPHQVSGQGCATAVIPLISLQRHHLLSANKIKDALHTSSPPPASLTLALDWYLTAAASDNSPEMKHSAASPKKMIAQCSVLYKHGKRRLWSGSWRTDCHGCHAEAAFHEVPPGISSLLKDLNVVKCLQGI